MGTFLLTIYGLRGNQTWEMITQATQEAGSSVQSSDQGQPPPKFEFQAIQCIVNYPPQSLWDRYCNNKIAYQERFVPKAALKDVPVDPNLKPEDRIDCTGEVLSDMLWTLVLAPEETEASRNLQSLASEAIARLLDAKQTKEAGSS